MTPSADQFSGCLLGLALGDALGAPHEGGIVERALWRLIGRTRSGHRRYTDDTQMSLDLAESLIEHGRIDCGEIALRFALGYRWSRGYGPGAARVLRRIRRGMPWREASRTVYPEGSWGNGGAMRAPVVGLFHFADADALIDAARCSAEVTHAHPLAIEGAVAVALATATALATRDGAAILDAAARNCRLPDFAQRFSVARSWLEEGAMPPPAMLNERLGTSVSAPQSCVTAIYLAVRFLDRPFAELIAFVAACGGDVDTIGAMAGAIWGACNGAAGLPAPALDTLEDCGRIRSIALRLHAGAIQRGAAGQPRG